MGILPLYGPGKNHKYISHAQVCNHGKFPLLQDKNIFFPFSPPFLVVILFGILSSFIFFLHSPPWIISFTILTNKMITNKMVLNCVASICSTVLDKMFAYTIHHCISCIIENMFVFREGSTQSPHNQNLDLCSYMLYIFKIYSPSCLSTFPHISRTF